MHFRDLEQVHLISAPSSSPSHFLYLWPLSGACCPSSVKLYRMVNNTLRVYWRSSPGLYNYTADLYGTSSNYTCSTTQGATACDVSNIMCGEVYTVVVAPLTQQGSKVTFCPRKLYSGTKRWLIFKRPRKSL